MQIANPIYDVVFKFLMEDNDVAKLLISEIIGEEIVTLAFCPKENSTTVKEGTLTVYRLDFAATIRTPSDSVKKVLIEIQKAKFPTDIMRFRKYIGEEYSDNSNVIKGIDGENHAIPLLTLYFLGHKLQHIEAPVIKVKRNYYDIIAGEEIGEKDEFIESLTHDAFVIQVPHLKVDPENDLLTLLSIFRQSDTASGKRSHFLEIQQEAFPEKYDRVLRRLVYALAEKKVRKSMDLEDEIVEELENRDRKILETKEKLEESEKKLEENNRKLEEKEAEIERMRLELEALKK